MVSLTEISSIYGKIREGETPNAEGGSDVPAVSRALDVLELLAQSPQPLTLSQIIAVLGLPKGSAHRLLTTLRGRGYVVVAENSPQSAESVRGTGYILGRQAAWLASHRPPAPDLAQAARQPMRQLARETGEGCQLSLRAGDQAVVMARTDSPQHPEIALTGAIGANFPLHAVAVGKILLAFAPEAARAAYLAQPLLAFTPRTVTDSDALTRQLDALRADGESVLARDDEEYKRGLCALAVPVWDASGSVCAALGLPFLAGADSGLQHAYAAALQTAARAIGQALGHIADK